MLIESITLNNYRLYEGENVIKFRFDEAKNVHLICGENGFGKTTLLHSLLWCLFGRFVGDVPVSGQETNSSYAAMQKEILNQNAAKRFEEKATPEIVALIKKNGYTNGYEEIKKDSVYSVAICFAEVGIPSIPCQKIVVTRNYDSLLQKEEVEILIDGVKNELTDEIGPEVFINDFILNKDIAKLFFFDSEEIVSLADTGTIAERRKLSKAYEEVLGIRKYEELRSNLEGLRLRYRKKSKDIGLKDELEKLEAEREGVSNELTKLTDSLTEIEATLTNLREQDGQLQLQLSREGNSVKTEELQRVKAVIEKCKKDDIEMKSALKQFIDYAPFAISGQLFARAYELAKADHEAIANNNTATAQNCVLDALSKEMKGLLDKMPVNKDSKRDAHTQLEAIIEKYRGRACDRDIQVTLTDDEFAEVEAVYNSLTTTYRIEFEALAEAYRKNKITLERNVKRLSNIQSKESDEVIKGLRDNKNKIEAEIKTNEEKQRLGHIRTGELQLTIESYDKKIKELSRKISVDDADEAKDKLASELITELDTFLLSLKKNKKSSLELRIKNTLNTLMHKEDFISHVEVELDSDTMDINLFSSDGNVINKNMLSKGEKQLYATSILKALVDESGIQFPVFIDSPLQKFDKSHSSKIISEFYPSISKQVILFPLLHKELTEAEYKTLQPFVESATLIVNDTSRSYFEAANVKSLMQKN
ncbi:DNA sulfur modification protein DndD [Xylanibacter ruminicola]|uniref:DNA sulfur modification protein DndD n=1 Tax=Xylanibacter ruminicola TaxID=839 RepID=A0A1H5RYW5_XYLRU|nr:ATP-binding protein [Xylanibacter ruminicola]SEF43515.1 DNA sulfur modification protein DndD [Xylanibacter ruminicola]